MLKYILSIVPALALSACAGFSAPDLPNQTDAQREAQIKAAEIAVTTGNFASAEKLMAPYLYRDATGELVMHYLGVSSDANKSAVDTVALLLWDTGRDATLESFAKRYLRGYERQVMLCRLAERQASYDKAYSCWNGEGDVDRARRVIRTESALKILSD